MGPTFRFDPFTGEHVLLSPGRAGKPTGHEDRLPTPAGPCPFCPGNEASGITLAVLPTDAPWQVRTLANRYPAVRPDAPDDADGKGARGAHEVIVEGRDHDRDLPTLAASVRRLVLRAYRDRVAALEQSAGYVHLFRNRGLRAGSSQPHPHAQVLATEHIAEAVQRRWQRAERFYTEHGLSLLQGVLANELADGRRVVRTTPAFVVLCPIAPRLDGETWIVPRDRGAFSQLDPARLDALADLLGETLPAVLDLGRSSYNLVWRQPPAVQRDHPGAFWTLEILPRGGASAGYEQSSESALVTLPPEEAARRIRRSLGTA